MKAIMLAAGKGTRMELLTNLYIKPMLPIVNKPILFHGLQSLRDAGLEEVIIVIGYNGKSIKSYFGENFGTLKISYSLQKDPLGTSHAILTALQSIPGEQDVLAFAGDSLFTSKFISSLVKLHQQKNCSTTIALEEMSPKKMQYSSTVQIENGTDLYTQGGIIKNIVEKPSRHQILSKYSGAAMWLVKTKDFIPEAKSTQLSTRGEFEVQNPLNAMISQGKLVMGLGTRVRFHITTYQDLFDVNMRFLENEPTILEESKNVIPPVLLGESVELTDDVLLGPQVILGSNTRVKRGSRISNSVIFGGSLVQGTLNHVIGGNPPYLVQVRKKNLL